MNTTQINEECESAEFDKLDKLDKLIRLEESEKTNGKNLSPAEKKKRTLDKYGAYVERLQRNKDKFPLNQLGEVNHSVIAKSCRFRRQVFFNNKTLKLKLEDDVKKIGTCLIEGKSPETVMDQNLTLVNKLLNKKSKDLSIAEGTIAGLKKQILQLENENKQLKNQSQEETESFNYMIETGRRFTL
jgi:hypothetical protein